MQNIEQASRRAMSRRRLIAGVSVAGLTLPLSGLLGACASDKDEQASTLQPPPKEPAEALERLLAGNKRFASGLPTRVGQDEARRVEVAKGQKPFVAIVGCVDSRVPPEIVFDQGLGDVFTARVAAGIANDDTVASIEFGVEEFKIPLLVVMGHQRCGAVNATIEAIEAKATSAPGEIIKLVTAIKPAVDATAGKPGDHLDNAVRETSRLSAAILAKSPVLSERVKANELMIVDAYYNMESGAVELLT